MAERCENDLLSIFGVNLFKFCPSDGLVVNAELKPKFCWDGHPLQWFMGLLIMWENNSKERRTLVMFWSNREAETWHRSTTSPAELTAVMTRTITSWTKYKNQFFWLFIKTTIRVILGKIFWRKKNLSNYKASLNVLFVLWKYVTLLINFDFHAPQVVVLLKLTAGLNKMLAQINK